LAPAVGVARAADRLRVGVDFTCPGAVAAEDVAGGNVVAGVVTAAVGALGPADTAAGAGDGEYGLGAGVEEQPATRTEAAAAANGRSRPRGRAWSTRRAGMALYPHGHRR